MPDKFSEGPKGWQGFWQSSRPDGVNTKEPVPSDVIFDRNLMNDMRDAYHKISSSPYVKGLGADYTPNPSGDCVGKARFVQEELKKKGYDEGALRLKVTNTEEDEPHMVLEVMTNMGPFTVDGRAKDVVPSNQLPYKDFARQIPGSFLWEDLK